jgi:integrase
MEEMPLNKDVRADLVEWMQVRGYSYNTIRQYKHTLNILSDKYEKVSNKNLRTIIKKFHHQNQRAVLHLINNYCFEKAIDFRLIIPRIKYKPRKTPIIYSIEEIKVLIQATPDPYNLAIRCIFNMGAGLRVSEMIRLSWNHIRWADWLPNQDNYGIAVIKASKGNKERVINIPSNLMKDLYKYANEQGVVNEYKVPVGGMIFPLGQDTYKPNLRTTDIEKWKGQFIFYAYNQFRDGIIRKYCEKALGKKVKIHSLRHSRATYLYEIEKVPIERIQVLLGHAEIGTTMIYTKVNPLSTFEMLKGTKEI